MKSKSGVIGTNMLAGVLNEIEEDDAEENFNRVMTAHMNEDRSPATENAEMVIDET